MQNTQIKPHFHQSRKSLTIIHFIVLYLSQILLTTTNSKLQIHMYPCSSGKVRDKLRQSEAFLLYRCLLDFCDGQWSFLTLPFDEHTLYKMKGKMGYRWCWQNLDQINHCNPVPYQTQSLQYPYSPSINIVQ